ncbi:MAG: ABC transporter substrate-binding protein [Pseudomonadota bacterium]
MTDGMTVTETDETIRLGFIPLLDAAPLIMALEAGFFAEEGLDVTLHRQPSWASLRDRVGVGMLDGAQMLGPMALAINMGLGAPPCPVISPMVLSRNGNAITARRALYEQLAATGFDLSEPSEAARALARVVASSDEPVRLGIVYAWSSHYLQLLDWLASAGLSPGPGLELVTVPPPEMMTALAYGSVDLACVGEPWNSLMEYHGLGQILATGCQVWQNAPEKVLGVRRDWADANPEKLRALMRAVIRCCRWLDDPVNRELVHRILVQPGYLGSAIEPLGDRGQWLFHPRVHQHFFRQSANFPWLSQAEWLLSRMRLRSQGDRVSDTPALDSIFRPDLYREVAESLGIDAPVMDYKDEGEHRQPFVVEGVQGQVEVASDALIAAGSRG